MDSQASVSSPPLRSPERWLAFLRIAIGLWFVKALFTKLSVILLWGFLPVPSASDRWIHLMPILVAKYAEGNPVALFRELDRKSTRLNSSHVAISYAVFCLKKKIDTQRDPPFGLAPRPRHLSRPQSRQ